MLVAGHCNFLLKYEHVMENVTDSIFAAFPGTDIGRGDCVTFLHGTGKALII